MRVAGRGDEDPVQTAGPQHRGKVAMGRQPGRRDARPRRFHRIGDGDDPKDVAAGKRAQMGLPHASCPHEAHAEDRASLRPVSTRREREAAASVGFCNGWRARWALTMASQSAMSRSASSPEVTGGRPLVTQSWKWINSSLKLSA